MATKKQLEALEKARAAKAKTSKKKKLVTKTGKQKDNETFKKTGFYYLSSPKDALKFYFLKNANDFSEIDIQNNMPYGIMHNGKKVKTVKKGTVYVLRETKTTAKRKPATNKSLSGSLNKKKVTHFYKDSKIIINDRYSFGELVKSDLSDGEYMLHFRTFAFQAKEDLEKIKKKIPKSLKQKRIYLVVNGEGYGYLNFE